MAEFVFCGYDLLNNKGKCLLSGVKFIYMGADANIMIKTKNDHMLLLTKFSGVSHVRLSSPEIVSFGGQDV